MTAYEHAVYQHHLTCQLASAWDRDLNNNPTNSLFKEMLAREIDRAYVLGLMIDSMPVELAEREI